MDNKPILKVNDKGTKQWYLNGRRHREDGPAVESVDGEKQWYLNGHPHREDGPAIEYANGTKVWYLHGKRHREDGPAAERAAGIKEWCLHDISYTFDEWLDQNTALSDEEKLMMKLIYG